MIYSLIKCTVLHFGGLADLKGKFTSSMFRTVYLNMEFVRSLLNDFKVASLLLPSHI